MEQLLETWLYSHVVGVSCVCRTKTIIRVIQLAFNIYFDQQSMYNIHEKFRC